MQEENKESEKKEDFQIINDNGQENEKEINKK